jgi:hypothetical protein
MVKPCQTTYGFWRKADVLAETALQMAAGYAKRRGERLYANAPACQMDSRERLLHRVRTSAGTACQRKQELVDMHQVMV